MRHLLLLRRRPNASASVHKEGAWLVVGLVHLLVVDPIPECLLAGRQAICHALVHPTVGVREENSAAEGLPVLV